MATTPRPCTQFLQLYVLCAKHMAAHYFPGNKTDVRLGESVTWYLGVTGNMDAVQLVAIRVKISNQTVSAPDDQRGLCSPAPVVPQFMYFVQDNETWETPFV